VDDSSQRIREKGTARVVDRLGIETYPEQWHTQVGEDESTERDRAGDRDALIGDDALDLVAAIDDEHAVAHQRLVGVLCHRDLDLAHGVEAGTALHGGASDEADRHSRRDRRRHLVEEIALPEGLEHDEGGGERRDAARGRRPIALATTSQGRDQEEGCWEMAGSHGGPHDVGD
jgi:hypothetical protein